MRARRNTLVLSFVSPIFLVDMAPFIGSQSSASNASMREKTVWMVSSSGSSVTRK